MRAAIIDVVAPPTPPDLPAQESISAAVAQLRLACVRIPHTPDWNAKLMEVVLWLERLAAPRAPETKNNGDLS